MKKFIAFILAFSFLVSSVAAADVYDIRPDTKVSLMSSAYDVALTSVTQSELDTTLSSYLQYSSKSVARYLYDIYQYIPHLADIRNALVSAGSNSPFWSSGSYLNVSGSSSYPSSSQSFTNILRQGFLGLSENILSLADEQGIDYRTVLSNILVAVNSVNTSVGTVNTSVGNVNTSVGTVNSSIVSGLGSSGAIYTLIDFLFLTPSNRLYLNAVGSEVSSSSPVVFSDLFRYGVLGLASLMRLESGSAYLNSGGIVSSAQSTLGLDEILRNGFLGLRSLISGSSTSNVYSGTSLNNENESTSFTATGLGPMLNRWLGDIQNDVALLSYVFASPQDLELKKESADNMDAVGESLLSSDSSASVKVSDITDISSASDNIQALGQTGVTPGQAFDQLDDSSLFNFFTAETAANLDTTVTTYSRDPHTQIVTNYYEQSRLDFFDLIGKEGDG